MKKWLSLLCCMAIIMMSASLWAVQAAASPSISLDASVYTQNATIKVTYSGTDTLDWVGLYPSGSLPGGGVTAIKWDYAVGSGTLTFSASVLNGPGEYVAYLCDNDGYAVLDSVAFTVVDNDTSDYAVRSATVSASVTNGKSSIAVTVTPASSASLTYRFYWAANGKRLSGYLPIKEVTHSGSAAFTVNFNDCLFMPDEADSVEVAVVNGRSGSYFASAPSSLKAPESELLYEFQVVTDMHIADYHAAHTPNLQAALYDIAEMSPDSQAIISVGDHTDKGSQVHYDVLLQTLNGITADLPPMYFAMGNHDMVWSGTYEEQVQRFIDNLGMPGVNYAVDIQGSRFIILGSDVQTGEGDLSAQTLAWFEEQLAATDPNTPAFVFLHQPLKDTVSGTLTALDAEIQDWYGFTNSGNEIRRILKRYPNAIAFSGHTHWSLEQTQPLLYGNGTDASFMNAASVGYLWSDEDAAIGGSEGLYIEVYEDYILIKGREYTQGVWCAAAQFLIPLHEVSTDPYEGNLVSDTLADWTYDASLMQLTKESNGMSFANTNGGWPCADYTYEEQITLDPSDSLLYFDMTLEKGAMANVLLLTSKGDPLSLNPYFTAYDTESGSGDLIGNGERIRGVIPMKDVAFADNAYNANGTVSIYQTRVYASGDAYAKLTVNDLSIVNKTSDKTVTLLRPDALSAVNSSTHGGYEYDNGKLTVTSDTASGYQVTLSLDETYNIAALSNWLVNVRSTVPFNIAMNVTAANDSPLGPNLAGDYWPLLCDALENGYLPAGSYEAALDLYSCYTYNKVAPEDGMSTVKSVTVTLAGAGELTVNALQLSSDTVEQTFEDGVVIRQTTPAALKGDVNGDGDLTTIDVRMALCYALGAGHFSDEQITLADFTGDGDVTTADVRDMLRAALM